MSQSVGLNAILDARDSDSTGLKLSAYSREEVGQAAGLEMESWLNCALLLFCAFLLLNLRLAKLILVEAREVDNLSRES